MIFFWIPKTGGTTFSHNVPGMKIVTENYSSYEAVSGDNVTFGHACPKLLIRHSIIPRWFWENEGKVVIVRNPYDRFLSLYKDFKASGRILPEITQAGFIRAIMEMDPRPGLFNSYKFSQCSPQTEWVLPGVEVKRFEDIIVGCETHLNKGNTELVLDDDAVDMVEHYYRQDFFAFNYSR